MAHEIEIEALPATSGASRSMWRVWHNGAALIERARDPEFAACRVLQSRGLSGDVVSRHRGSATVSFRMTIEAGAQMSTQEGGSARVRVVKWQPRDYAADVDE